MGLIKEPLNIDFEVDSRPLTRKEEKLISDFIKLRKEKNSFNKKNNPDKKVNKILA